MKNILNKKLAVCINAIMSDVYNGRLSPNASVIIIYFLNHGVVHDRDGYSYIEFSARQLSKLLGLNSPDAVRKYVNEAVNSGYLCLYEQKGLVNQYRFKIEKVIEDYGV